MKALTLVTVLALSSICSLARADDKADIEKKLKADYDSLLAKDPNARTVMKAADLLAATDKRANFRNYTQAIELLRKCRSKAGVPLLMQYMLQPDRFAWFVETSFADTLTILTGNSVEIPRRGHASEAEMIGLLKTLCDSPWYRKLDKMSTRLADFTDKQLENVLDRLVDLSSREMMMHSYPDRRELNSAYDIYHVVYYKLLHLSSFAAERAPWYKEDLSPNMVPIMLKRVGWQKTGNPASAPAANETATGPEMIYELIPMLAQLRKDKQAKDLDKIALDKTQSSACRLTCLLTLSMAGEKVPTEAFITIAQKETSLTHRLVAIISLPAGSDKAKAFRAAMAALRDENGEIVSAAVWALGDFASPEAVQPLKTIITKDEPTQAVLPALIALGRIKTAGSADALAGFFSAAAQDTSKAGNISRALLSFQEVTGYDALSAGAHDQADYVTAAAKAVKWWRGQNGKLPAGTSKR